MKKGGLGGKGGPLTGREAHYDYLSNLVSQTPEVNLFW